MKKALIVVDYQNDFVNGSLGFEQASSIEEIIYEKIVSYKNENHDVIFTFDTHDKTYLNTREGKNLPIEHCLEDSLGWTLYGKIEQFYDENSIAFVKHTFGSLELAEFVKKENYDELELVGLVSNMCVISNAVLCQAAVPNANIIIDAKATLSFDMDMQEKALDVMQGLHMKVINRD